VRIFYGLTEGDLEEIHVYMEVKKIRRNEDTKSCDRPAGVPDTM
jgi:hypothetical protein